jgi:glucans biosynthesis protein
MKIKDASKSTEMRAALVQDIGSLRLRRCRPGSADKARPSSTRNRPRKPRKPSSQTRPSHTGAGQDREVLTETWSYQLPADE